MKRIFIFSFILIVLIPPTLLAEKPGWTGKGRPEKIEVYGHKEGMNAKHDYKKAEKLIYEKEMKGKKDKERTKSPKRR